jgi:hypothetical protein
MAKKETPTTSDYDLLVIKSGIYQDVIDVVLNIKETEISNRLVVAINTRGGSPYVAYRAMTHLQHMYQGRKIEFVVPDAAMSAGTLMCLGGDVIYMHEGSCLGPLDLQVEHPSDGERISSLDIQQASYRILSLTQLVAAQMFDQARGTFGLTKTDAAKVSYNSAVKLFTPLVDKIDPYHLQEGFRSGPISEKYARFLLTRSINDAETLAKIAKTLSESYQTHGYAITKDEAEYLGLNVQKLTDMDIYNHVMSMYNASNEGVHYAPVRFQPQTAKEKPNEE